MSLPELLMILGFALAAYSVISNDSIQTLGTFLSSNAHRPWWVMWIFGSSILLVVLVYGWYANAGDPAYGRLESFPPPAGGVTWLHVLAPFTLLILTRFGVPVSTTFLVLSVFAPGNIDSMLFKSLSGYLVAFVVAILLYLGTRKLTAYLTRSAGTSEAGAIHWVVLQWASTAFLWSQWLIQDLANIFVFLPRVIDLWALVGSIALLLAIQGVIFYQHGGAIQKIVTLQDHDRGHPLRHDHRLPLRADPPDLQGMEQHAHEHHLGVPGPARRARGGDDAAEPGTEP